MYISVIGCAGCDKVDFNNLDSCTSLGGINIRMLGFVNTIYNMSGRVVSDIQTRAEGESLYIRYNTAANSSYEFTGEVILKINVV
jgi:hypothetical protein